MHFFYQSHGVGFIWWMYQFRQSRHYDACLLSCVPSPVRKCFFVRNKVCSTRHSFGLEQIPINKVCKCIFNGFGSPNTSEINTANSVTDACKIFLDFDHSVDKLCQRVCCLQKALIIIIIMPIPLQECVYKHLDHTSRLITLLQSASK